jgi:Ca2+-binding RTX toxin-like protein
MANKVNINRISQFPATSESGKVAEYSISLSAAPMEDVTIQFTSGNTAEGKLQNSSITFTQQNWSTAQSLYIQGVDDFLDDGNVAYSVTGKVVTDDLTYNRVIVPVINLTNLDDGQDTPLYIRGDQGENTVDYIVGKNGNDRLYGGYDQDNIKGGRGDDRIYGEQDDDLLFGELGNDKLYGGYDDDKLNGGEGNDQLFGEQGLDTLLGGNGNDVLDGGIEGDSMVGGVGNDTYYVDSLADKIVDSGTTADIDTVIVTQSITYTLAAGIENAQTTALGDSNLTGNSLSNSLAGNDGKNILDGGTGNDALAGGAGSDSLLGGIGNDELAGGVGNDTMRGGAGVDCADFEKAGISINVNLQTGKATGEGSDLLFDIEDICAGSGNDTLTGSNGVNDIEGGAGNDRVDAGGGNDVVEGGAGLDTLLGGVGNDEILGGVGRDSLNGGAGVDTLTGCFDGANGGRGEIDRLTGGAEADLFELGWSGGCYYNDGSITSTGTTDYALITDFQVGVDRLQLDGAVSNYYIGASVSGVNGFGVWYEQGAKDELVAVVQSSTTVTVTNTLQVALYV